MSDRQRVREMLAHKAIGIHAWYARTTPPQHVCNNAPECGLPKDADEAAKVVEAAYAEADALYVSVMDRVDWHRALMLAASRHRHMTETYPGQHLSDEDTSLTAGVTGVCGDCLNQAVLADAFGAYIWDPEVYPDTPSREYDPERNHRR